MSWYDNGMPVINDPDVLCTAELIRRLYDSPEGGNGGPLHAIVDDGNTGDEHVHDSDYFGQADGRTIETYLCKRGEGTQIGGVYFHEYIDELYCSEETADLCRLILASFRRMPEPWRAAAIAWADGTIARNLPILHDNPKAACEASPGQVDEFVADLRRRMEQGDAPKACVSVPCPPFSSETPGEASGSHGERPPQFRWAEATGPLELLREEHEERLDGMPQWQEVAWDHCEHVMQQLLVHGDAYCQQGPGDSFMRWEKISDPGCADGEQRYALRIDSLPQVDVAQLLIEDAGRPPQVLYRGGPMLPTAEQMFGRWLADPQWDSDKAPLFVGVPDTTSTEELAAAIKLCQGAGLFPPTPLGILFLPSSLDLP